MSKEYPSWRNLTLLQFKDQLLQILRGNLSKTTIELYNQALLKFAETVGNIPLHSVNPYHVERWKANRLLQVSAVKVSIDYRTLRAAFNRAVRFKMIDSNPFLLCQNVRIPEKSPRFLSTDEFGRLLQVIHDHQMRSIVLLAVSTAMRLGEILSLRWENIDLERGFIHLRNREDFVLKGKRKRSIPLNNTALRVLANIPRRSDFVFSGKNSFPLSVSTVSRRFKKYVRRAKLSEEIHFHTLRHTGATWLIEINVPISYVKEILGHASISTTQIYAHCTSDHLRESLLKIDSFLLN